MTQPSSDGVTFHPFGLRLRRVGWRQCGQGSERSARPRDLGQYAEPPDLRLLCPRRWRSGQ